MEIYLVGGAVRDELLQIPVREKDWVVIGSSPEEMIEKGYQPVGRDFPVFLHPQTKEEYALARTERKVGVGHKGFKFHCSPEVTLEEDLIRRDLTINAIAKDPKTNTLIDPHGGIIDIESKLLRKVSEAFIEDPLRVLRVARFQSKLSYLGFKIEEGTLKTMESIAFSGELKELSKERIWLETNKALLEKNPSDYFEVLNECNVLKELCSGDLQTFKKIKEALNILINTNLKPEIIWSVFVTYSEKLNQINNAFNPPKKFQASADIFLKIIMLLSKNEIEPKNIFDLLMVCDALRRPERVINMLPAIDILTKHYGYSLINWEELIIQTCKVTPDEEFLKSSGPNISKHLKEKRLRVVQEVIKIES